RHGELDHPPFWLRQRGSCRGGAVPVQHRVVESDLGEPPAAQVETRAASDAVGDEHAGDVGSRPEPARDRVELLAYLDEPFQHSGVRGHGADIRPDGLAGCSFPRYLYEPSGFFWNLLIRNGIEEWHLAPSSGGVPEPVGDDSASGLHKVELVALGTGHERGLLVRKSDESGGAKHGVHDPEGREPDDLLDLVLREAMSCHLVEVRPGEIGRSGRYLQSELNEQAVSLRKR